jgi:hypothetical protein
MQEILKKQFCESKTIVWYITCEWDKYIKTAKVVHCTLSEQSGLAGDSISRSYFNIPLDEMKTRL